MVREGDELLVELITPAANLVGFEHQPENEAQHQQVEQALAMLEAPSNLATFPEAARCELQEQEIETNMAGVDPAHHEEHEEHEEHADEHDEEHEEHADESHADHDEHGDDHGHEGEEVHSEFHARYVFRCQDMNALDSAELPLFDTFQGMEEVEVVIVGPNGQTKAEVTPGDSRLDL